jgi:type I restriction enzyme R subunit
MNEAETRAEHIDPSLKAAGWGVEEGSRVRREVGITHGRIERGKRGKGLTADYVLEFRNTKLAVIEAKAWDEGVTEGVAQAKNYASKLQVRFAFATNGQGVYRIDMETGEEASVARFPTPSELWDETFRKADAWRDKFASVPFEDKGGSHPGRYYQDIAVERVMQAIAEKRTRILLTLATGTGKTFVAFQIAWKLFHARWTTSRELDPEKQRRPRILFLADRNILANQAFNAFSAFPEDALVRIKPDAIRKHGKVPKNGNIFFTIFQTFMSGSAKETAESEAQEATREGWYGDYPPDFFDFIIIDECHRGGANDESNWRGILEYFAPAVQLGLTATPKRKDNVDTYAYFGEPVFTYSLKEGINDGFLTPFRVRQESSTIDDYIHTKDDTVLEGEIEAGRRYEEKDFNRTIAIDEREQDRVKTFMNAIDQREKTLVFCASQDHARDVRDYINQTKKSIEPNYCQRVTADDGELGEQHLRDFQDNEKSLPTILTTSQKLSTGVDARNVRNIVLMRPVTSMIEFKQIIGRGTRLYDGKDYFTIYDFVKAHHHFSDPEWDGEPTEPEPTPQPRPRETQISEPPEPYKRQRVKVKLSDGKQRAIQHMTCTTYWHPDGTPLTAHQFMELLFGKLPDFFKDEAELRALWSMPETRKKLLEGLAEKGFGASQLAEMQKIIDAEKSDLFDVLANVAYAAPVETREERAERAKRAIEGSYGPKQNAFLSFVLDHYVRVGVEELAQEKLSSLLRLRYRDSLRDAVADLGRADEIGLAFSGFQRFLYELPKAA